MLKPASVSLDEITTEAIEKCSLPIKLTWNGVNFSVTEVQKVDGKKIKVEKEILRNNAGYAMPGTTTFIMGASGSGKTSLLNLLSDRIALRSGNSIGGDVKFNDQVPVTQKSFG